ncbi:ammonium transporter [Synechococcus sp. PCC 7336]|uniref:ammonium transporter n=1 Tax=Synechococcus sp. PCC 7336 TaxID=195250 RepID=UPI0003496600|nr:ammonium transporter [Synechococcus sp. PCC 7336]
MSDSKEARTLLGQLFRRKVLSVGGSLALVAAFWLACSQAPAFAQDEITADVVQTNANILWTVVAATLVFFMQAGFAMVEAGFTRSKNAANIMMKNLMDFSLGACAFWFVGFGFMFGTSSGLIGGSWFAFTWQTAFDADAWPFTFFVFQMVFAATAATIVSGAMAERTKFASYLIYSIVLSGIIYPISGGWAWNGLFGDYNGGSGGWLEGLGYIDYAGSGVVHLVGGAAALAGAIVLGPRIGKYSSTGEPRALPGHNLPLGMLGIFILTVGWIGFNAGSTTSAIPDMGWIAMNTFLAAAAGAIGAMFTSWSIFKKPDMTFAGNGMLAGLVGITAPCDSVGPIGALVIGSIAGILVVLSVLFIETVLKVDDPVGAVSVHGTCGIWGVLASGLPFLTNGNYDFGWSQFGTQVVGALAYFFWPFLTMLLAFFILRVTIGLRVTAEEEMAGLDMGEHGNVAYPDFVGVPSATDTEM